MENFSHVNKISDVSAIMKTRPFIKLYTVQKWRGRHDIQWQCNWSLREGKRERQREICTCAVQSETVTHLKSFPIMKQDMERLCFNGEREGERGRGRGRERKKWKQQIAVCPSCCLHLPSLIVQPGWINAYLLYSDGQRLYRCVYKGGKGVECLCVSVSLSFVFTQYDR